MGVISPRVYPAFSWRFCANTTMVLATVDQWGGVGFEVPNFLVSFATAHTSKTVKYNRCVITCLLTGDWQGRVRCGRRQESTTTSARNSSTPTTASTTDKGPERPLRCVSPAKSNLCTYLRRRPASSPAATDDDDRRRHRRHTRDPAPTCTVARCHRPAPGRSCTTPSTAAARPSTRATSNTFMKVRRACVKTWTDN